MRTYLMLVSIAALVWGGCGKGGDSASSAGSGAATSAAGGATGPVSAAVAAGIKAGGITHGANEGPGGVLSKVNGTVEVKRVGETKFTPAKQDDKLYPGDQVRTGDKSTATVVLADQSVIEVAEVSTIGIASRDGTADPGSAAAVLAGIARFTVTPRAPAEGTFRVYTPSGFVVTKGTTYGVGVDASGDTRVGVENGQVDVVGLAQQDAPPVEVGSGSAAIVDAQGSASAPVAFPSDDWGQWRDDADAKVDAGSAVDAHGQAMTNLDKQLADGYSDLDTSANAVSTFETSAASAADSNDPATYQAAEPAGAVAIDGSFAVGGNLEALTWAYAGHAELASEIYVRHPELEPRWRVIAPRVDAAVLWPKRYEVAATGYFEPLRMQYYVHDPIGRVHAPLVGVTVPKFYAGVTLAPVDTARIRAGIHGHVWLAPEVAFRAQARPVWATVPAVNWAGGVRVEPAPWRGQAGWCVRPAELHAHLLVGAEVRGRIEPRLEVGPPIAREDLRAQWRVPVGVRVRVGEPDYAAAERARASVVLDPGGRIDVREHAVVDVRGRGEVVRPGVEAGVRVHPGAAIGVRPGAVVHEHVRAPEIHGAAHVDVKVKGNVRVGR